MRGNDYMNITDYDRFVGLARQLYKEDQERVTQAVQTPTTPTIQVVIVEPFKKPYKELIPNTLEKFNELVGGYIENVFIGAAENNVKIGLLVNEEGKLQNLPFNRKLFYYNGNFEILVGRIVVTAYNDRGENISLPDKEAEKYIKRFTQTEVYI
jgi:uncharacterized protein DUF3846